MRNGREQAAGERQNAERQTLRQNRQGETGGERDDAGAPAVDVERRSPRRRRAGRTETGKAPGPRHRGAGIGRFIHRRGHPRV